MALPTLEGAYLLYDVPGGDLPPMFCFFDSLASMTASIRVVLRFLREYTRFAK